MDPFWIHLDSAAMPHISTVITNPRYLKGRPFGVELMMMAIATSDDGLRAISQQTHRVSTSDGTRKEGIGVEGFVRGGGPEGEERGRRDATASLTPPKLLDNTDTKQI